MLFFWYLANTADCSSYCSISIPGIPNLVALSAERSVSSSTRPPSVITLCVIAKQLDYSKAKITSHSGLYAGDSGFPCSCWYFECFARRKEKRKLGQSWLISWYLRSFRFKLGLLRDRVGEHTEISWVRFKHDAIFERRVRRSNALVWELYDLVEVFRKMVHAQEGPRAKHLRRYKAYNRTVSPEPHDCGWPFLLEKILGFEASGPVLRRRTIGCKPILEFQPPLTGPTLSTCFPFFYVDYKR